MSMCDNWYDWNDIISDWMLPLDGTACILVQHIFLWTVDCKVCKQHVELGEFLEWYGPEWRFWLLVVIRAICVVPVVSSSFSCLFFSLAGTAVETLGTWRTERVDHCHRRAASTVQRLPGTGWRTRSSEVCTCTNADLLSSFQSSTF